MRVHARSKLQREHKLMAAMRILAVRPDHSAVWQSPVSGPLHQRAMRHLHPPDSFDFARRVRIDGYAHQLAQDQASDPGQRSAAMSHRTDGHPNREEAFDKATFFLGRPHACHNTVR